MIEYQLSQQFPDLKLFTTTRRGGVSKGNYATFNPSPFSGDKPEDVEENLKLLSAELNITPENIIFPYQMHQTGVRKIDAGFMKSTEAERVNFLYGIDALVTDIPGICIGVTTADCVPVFFYDDVRKVTAVAHAGWRGTCAGIVTETIGVMQADYGCIPNNIYVVIGPSISVNVYQVGEELYTAFLGKGFPVASIFTRNAEVLLLDLWKANEYLLLQCGITAGHIEIAGRCTYTEHDLFFSARRLGIKSGRMLSGIMMSNQENI